MSWKEMLPVIGLFYIIRASQMSSRRHILWIRKGTGLDQWLYRCFLEIEEELWHLRIRCRINIIARDFFLLLMILKELHSVKWSTTGFQHLVLLLNGLDLTLFHLQHWLNLMLLKIFLVYLWNIDNYSYSLFHFRRLSLITRLHILIQIMYWLSCKTFIWFLHRLWKNRSEQNDVDTVNFTYILREWAQTVPPVKPVLDKAYGKTLIVVKLFISLSMWIPFWQELPLVWNALRYQYEKENWIGLHANTLYSYFCSDLFSH